MKNDLTKILESVGAEIDESRMDLLFSLVKDKDVTELIAAGREKMAALSSGGPAVAMVAGGGGDAPSAAEPAAESKKVEEEKEESEESKLHHLCDDSSPVETTGNVVGVGQVQDMKNVVDVAKREAPGFTVYVNRRPTSMAEVIKDLEDQFTTICDAAREVSGLLEASRAQYAPSFNEHSARKMLNPVALFRSGSSRSSSSRFLITSSSGSKESGSESRSDVSDESCMISGSHQTTLDKLFAWEKKLYDEVRAGERVRRIYEKKCMQLRNQDVKGDDPSSVDKTRATIRDLDTQIKVSIHSIFVFSQLSFWWF